MPESTASFCCSSAVHQVVAVRDAVAVGDDERRAGVALGFQEGLDRLVVLGAEGDLGHVDVAVAHGDQAQVLLGDVLAGRRRTWPTAPSGVALDCLAAGVGVDLGVEHEDVDVAVGGEHVVEAAVADVVGPAVAAEIQTLFLTR